MSKPGFTDLTPVLCVNDLVTSLKHYQQILGFKTVWQWSDAQEFDEPEHPTFALVERGKCGIFLCERGQGKPGAWLCLNLQTPEELAALYQEYQASGADIAQSPQDYSWGMREMLVRDLDGNTFRMGTMVSSADSDKTGCA